MQEHKAAIDGLIGEIFHEVRNRSLGCADLQVAATNEESEDGPLANGHSSDVKPDVKPALPSLDDSNGVPASSPAIPLGGVASSSKTKRVKIEVDGEQLEGETDEQMARRLQSEYNGRESLSRRAAPKRSSSGVSRGPKKGAKGSRSKISEEFIEDSDDENGSSSTAGPMRTAKKRSSGGGAKGGFAKAYQLSPELAAIVGSDQMSRPQVCVVWQSSARSLFSVKNLWVYIREVSRNSAQVRLTAQHNLQNPSKRTEIICDETGRSGQASESC